MTKKPIHNLLLFFVFCSLLSQGCAITPRQEPVYYPPPPPTQPPVIQHPVPDVKPIKPPPPPRTDIIAADFILQAEAQARLGKFDQAAVTLERGLRAAPKNATLWSKLAEVRLSQQQYQQASSLAAKSNSLAGSEATILQKNYWIIEEARRKSAGQ